jgi:hypothetical protein
MSFEHPQFVVCVSNEGYPASLELRKVYRLLEDADAERVGHVRVIDESGEDYLYPADWFVPFEPSQSLRTKLEALAPRES